MSSIHCLRYIYPRGSLQDERCQARSLQNDVLSQKQGLQEWLDWRPFVKRGPQKVGRKRWKGVKHVYFHKFPGDQFWLRRQLNVSHRPGAPTRPSVTYKVKGWQHSSHRTFSFKKWWQTQDSRPPLVSTKWKDAAHTLQKLPWPTCQKNLPIWLWQKYFG